MTSWHSYPKLYNLGHSAIADLLAGDVVVEEKVDGSQFSFGLIDGVLRCRSKGQELNLDAPEKMFLKAVNVVSELAPRLIDGWTYRAEYLSSPKHNTLAYDRIPERHLIVFDVNTGEERYLAYSNKAIEAQRLGLEVVPLIHQGTVDTFDAFKAMIDRVSLLGGAKVEGVVIKNYARFGADGKALMGKYVSEAFKEVHKGDWRERNPASGDIIENLIARYRTPARWAKAVQHLRDAGKLTETPKDIGALVKEAQDDVRMECESEIKAELFAWAWDKVARGVINGLPQWYKDELAKRQFEEPAA